MAFNQDALPYAEPNRQYRHGRILKIYYFLTPLFVMVELLFGLNLRITFPFTTFAGAEYIYCGLCFMIPCFLLKKDLWISLFSLTESVLNILFLCLSVLMPYFNLAKVLDQGGDLGFKFGVAECVHFLIAGAVLLYSFYTNPIVRYRPHLESTF